MELDQQTIRREVERLAPWYYRFDLRGVRTDATEPCDHAGHRVVSMPEVRQGFWEGKTVLDMGCAEGALGFGALERGAARVRGVDCRASHVEKARFVARVLGHDRITFEIGSADRWPDEHPDERFDAIIFCGLIYHLQDPVATIAKYCRLAREAILVTSVLWGGEDGWTLWKEFDTIGASEGVLDSLMPNTVDTIITEFGRHGFVPTHVYETYHQDFDGGCALMLERVEEVVRLQSTVGSDPEGVDIHVGRPSGILSITFYNRRPEAWSGTGTLILSNAEGEQVSVKGPVTLDFPARSAKSPDEASRSIDFREELRDASTAGPMTAVIRVTGPDGGIVRESTFHFGS